MNSLALFMFCTSGWPMKKYKYHEKSLIFINPTSKIGTTKTEASIDI